MTSYDDPRPVMNEIRDGSQRLEILDQRAAVVVRPDPRPDVVTAVPGSRPRAY